jgi:hypothetical protein
MTALVAVLCFTLTKSFCFMLVLSAAFIRPLVSVARIIAHWLSFARDLAWTETTSGAFCSFKDLEVYNSFKDLEVYNHQGLPHDTECANYC